MYLRHGWQFIDEFIIQQHFQRFVSNKYQHPQPFYFFFWVLPLMTIPWLPFFVIAIWQTSRRLIRSWIVADRGNNSPASDDRSDVQASPRISTTSLRFFSLSCLFVPVVFFSFSGSKLPGYILPAVPGTVLLTSIYIYQFLQKSLLRRALVQSIAIGTYVVVIVAVVFVLPGFARKESVKDLIDFADSHGYSKSSVLSFMTISHNAEFYAAGRLSRDPDGKQHRFIGPHEIREYIDQHNGDPVIVLTPKDQVSHLLSNNELEVQVLQDNGDLDVAAVRWK
jgi:hypothetical protein